MIDINLDEFFYSRDIELAKGSYQFLESSNEYNESYFSQVYEELERVISNNFYDEQEFYLVINKFLKRNSGKDIILPKILRSRKGLTISGKYLDKTEEKAKQQLVISIKKEQIKWENLLKSIINQDFPDRKPRFKTTESYAYPEVYFVNQDESLALYFYDDRGYTVFKKKEEKHNEK